MPVLITLLRQYGLREYLLMLTVAAVCGLGVAALINAASGDVAGGQALLKSKAQLEANSSRVLTTRVFKPVRQSHPQRRHAVRHQQPHIRRHRSAPVVAGPRVVAVRTPAPAPQPIVVQRPVAPRPAPRPVVRAPRPAPKPAATPKRSGGGSQQFDDSG